MRNPNVVQRKAERDRKIIDIAKANPYLTAAEIGKMVLYGRDVVFKVLHEHDMDRSQARKPGPGRRKKVSHV
jgi:hypothetical protein